MNSTLKTLKPLITGKYSKMELEEMSEEYKLSQSPEILATAFEKLFKLILTKGGKFTTVSSEDLASISLQKLDTCLMLYDPETAKFITFYLTSLHNALVNFTKDYYRSVGAFGSMVRLDDTAFDDNEATVGEYIKDTNAVPVTDIDIQVDLENYLDKLPLRRREMLTMFLTGGVDMTDSEIAQIYNCTTSRVNRTKHQLREDLCKLGFTY